MVLPAGSPWKNPGRTPRPSQYILSYKSRDKTYTARCRLCGASFSTVHYSEVQSWMIYHALDHVLQKARKGG